MLYRSGVAAQMLSMNKRTLWRYMEAGMIKYVTYGNERRISSEEIERVLREGLTIPAKGEKNEVSSGS